MWLQMKNDSICGHFRKTALSVNSDFGQSYLGRCMEGHYHLKKYFSSFSDIDQNILRQMNKDTYLNN